MYKPISSLRNSITARIIIVSLTVIAIVSVIIWCPSIILTGIIGFSEIMLLRSGDEETKETLRRIIATAERGSELTKQIPDRQEGPKQALQTRRCSRYG